MDTIVVSAFPGTGKTYSHKHDDLITLDSDSSKFSWIEKGIRHPDFPNNYIEHIKKNLGRANIIFVSSHKVVRNALVDAGIKFVLVFPERSCKNEYLNRFKNRGNDESFISFIENGWNDFIDEMEQQSGCWIIRLKRGEYISNILEDIF